MKKGENAGRAQARKINQIYTKAKKDENFSIRNEVAIRSSATFSELYSSLPGKCTDEVRKVANSGSKMVFICSVMQFISLDSSKLYPELHQSRKWWWSGTCSGRLRVRSARS